MPFIGNKPAQVPLTSADIADSIITSAKIVDGTIVNADINASAAIDSTKLTGITSPAGFRNIVINGDMQIAQRSTSVASITTPGYYTLDRFKFGVSSLGTWTMSQSTDVPTGEGFAKSLKYDCTTADASPSASDALSITTAFEGQNLQYLKKGTASALFLTASFWVKSTKTGTFICELYDANNNRQISAAYTISVSNTWEKKIITFAGDTTGAFTNDNGQSLILAFWLGAGTDFTSGTLNTSWADQVAANRAVGQVNIADSTSNDFLITGVQLEAGTSATDFEFLPIDVSLGRCQRYYYKIVSDASFGRFGSSYNQSTNVALGIIQFPAKMRAIPSALDQSGTAGDYAVLASAVVTCTSVPTIGSNGTNTSIGIVTFPATSGLTAGQGTQLISTSGVTTAFLGFSAEL
jgi:hypothetical protein